MLKNLFGDVALDINIKAFIKKIMGLSFDTLSQLRISGPVTISSGTVTTCSTVTTVTTVTTLSTGNMGLGDMGKNSTAQLVSYQAFHSGIGKNFIR